METTTVTAEKPVMVVGVDDSDKSLYALEWTLDHFFSPSSNSNSSSPNNFKLVVVHSKPFPISAIGFAGPGVVVLPQVESDLNKIAAKVIEKAKAICTSKSVTADVVLEVVEGDARNVLCEVVEKFHASMLVVGSHGYGAIKRALLGSVSDYCAHHAHCTVMIVKKPKTSKHDDPTPDHH